MKVQFELERKKCACKFADWFSSMTLPNRCRCTAEYSAIQRTVSFSIRTNQEIMKFTEEKKATHTQCSYSGPSILENTRETNQLRELKAVKVRFAP